MRSLTILDVGHGSCAVLRAENDEDVVVIDAGPGAQILEYLEQEGINRVSSVVVSHADADHLGGVVAMLAANTCEVGGIFLNSDASQESSTWSALMWDLDKRRRIADVIFETSLLEGQSIEFDGADVAVEVVAPRHALAGTGPGARAPDGRRIRTNTISAVLRITVDSQPVALLPGDLDDLGLDLLLETGQDLTAPVVLFPHHGGRTGAAGRGGDAQFARKFLDAVRPSTVLFSIGRGMHETPRPEIVRAIRERADVRVACTQLSAHCALAAAQAEAPHLLPIYARGRLSGSCCAGSFFLPLAAGGDLTPSIEEHQQFIVAAAPTALCSQGR